ncbi:MAG: hypothetical protein JNM17_16560 [Archangium sp.]|nr:hypothetical protein [Archangium sp.]
MAPAPALARCEAHQAVAGWECTACHRALCPDCAAERTVYPATVIVCAICGELAEELIQKRADAGSLASRLPGAFAFPFTSLEGAAAWLGIALWLYAWSFLGALGLLIGWGVAIGSLFGLTRSSASGKDHLELSDFQDPISSILVPFVRFAVAMVPAWGGALLALYTGFGWLNWVALAVTVLWSPTAFIGAATNANFVDMLNPFRVLRASAAMGKDFAVYALGLFVVLIVLVLSVPLAALVSKFVVVPVLGGLMVQLVLLYAPFVGARIAGLVLFLHPGVFGWGDVAEGYEGILKGTRPRGQAPVKEAQTVKNFTAIELPPEKPPDVVLQQARPRDRFAAIELDPESAPPPEVAPLDVALLPTHGEQSTEEIRRAIRERKDEVALDGFRTTGLAAAPHLTFDELMWLAQTAANRIDYESAELAFRHAVKCSGVALEPKVRAKVMLARLLGEKLKRDGEGRALMNEVLQEAPGTSAATFAQQWLAASRS